MSDEAWRLIAALAGIPVDSSPLLNGISEQTAIRLAHHNLERLEEIEAAARAYRTAENVDETTVGRYAFELDQALALPPAGEAGG